MRSSRTFSRGLDNPAPHQYLKVSKAPKYFFCVTYRLLNFLVMDAFCQIQEPFPVSQSELEVEWLCNLYMHAWKLLPR